RNISHIGLGVAAINTAKVLRRHGIKADVWPIIDAADLRNRLTGAPAKDVIVSAPWIPSVELQKLAIDFPDTRFAVNCHSNVGFLQADRNGVKLVRELMELEAGNHNIRLAGNCRRFCDWAQAAFAAPCAYLPNLYYLDEYAFRHTRTKFEGGTLRIGIFGAIRPQKNVMSAAGAGIEIARALRAPVEIWLSAGREEGGGGTVLSAVQEMIHGLPNVNLVFNSWQSWPKFRKVVGHMHLLLQPSYTESFNMVTADGVAEGVPSVVSHAIDWAPNHWKAAVDDVLDIARVGRHLLSDNRAAHDGLKALEGFVRAGLDAYGEYFSNR
ncbi:MAG: glycosyltransferase, partial [Acidobacteriaceae bacterium]|nr:glycosyltransferase [Acidobacteriaceae bacterium]